MPLAEGQEGEFGAGGVPYTAVTSCVTVTCKLDVTPAAYVGGHLSLSVPPGRLDSSQVLPAMKQRIAGRTIAKIHVAGRLDAWNDAYLTKPLFTGAGANAVSNYDTELPNTAEGALASVILGQLIDWDGDSPLPSPTHETREGAFTIAL
jgi:hypothetical protein